LQNTSQLTSTSLITHCLAKAGIPTGKNKPIIDLVLVLVLGLEGLVLVLVLGCLVLVLGLEGQVLVNITVCRWSSCGNDTAGN